MPRLFRRGFFHGGIQLPPSVGPQGGDGVVVFSNGGFGGIHGKLLDRLNRR